MSEAYDRFIRSMKIGLDEWRDGTGYDLAALAQLTPEEISSVEMMLRARGPDDWRAVEALASLKTPTAANAVRQQLEAADPVVRITAISRLFDAGEITDLTPHLVRLLNDGADYGSGWSQVMDMIWWHSVKGTTPALLEIAREGEGWKASHAAATLLFLHGLAKSPFDWSQRPFFLRFNTTDMEARRVAYEELCAKIGAAT